MLPVKGIEVLFLESGRGPVILNKTGVLKGGVCTPLLPRWIQTISLVQSTYCCPLDVRFLQTMVIDEEVGQLENMIGRPSSQMAYLFSSWRGFFK